MCIKSYYIFSIDFQYDIIYHILYDKNWNAISR